MAAALAVADVERLVVDQQPDDLAVGDVDHRLARLGVAVAGLGVGQRARLVEAVQVGAGQAVGLALVEVAAQADVPVGEREHRSGLGEHVQVQLGLAQRPRLDGEGGMLDHESSSSARSETTTSAPCARSSSAWPTRSTPTTQPKPPARPAATPASASSKTAACAGADAERPRAGQERVRRGLALQVVALGDDAVDALLEQILDPRRDQHLAAVAARRDDRAAQTGLPRRAHVAHRALVGLDALLADHAQHDLVLAVARARGRSPRRPDRSPRPPAGRCRARRGTSARRRSAACRRRTRRSRRPDRTARNGSPVLRRPLAQEAVEHLLPGRGMHLRGLREHAVQIEQARPRTPSGNPKHRESLRFSRRGSQAWSGKIRAEGTGASRPPRREQSEGLAVAAGSSSRPSTKERRDCAARPASETRKRIRNSSRSSLGRRATRANRVGPMSDSIGGLARRPVPRQVATALRARPEDGEIVRGRTSPAASNEANRVGPPSDVIHFLNGTQHRAGT